MAYYEYAQRHVKNPLTYVTSLERVPMVRENSFGALLTSFRLERQKAARAQRDKLEAAKWDTVRLPKQLGVARQTYSGWENDHHLPEPHDLRNITKVFRLSDEERDVLYLAAAQVPPRRHKLPPKNDFFTGREAHLERLSKLLEECRVVGITQAVSISGLGGIGKTQLALQYAHHHFEKNTYRAVLWVNAASEEMLQTSYRALLPILDLPEQEETDKCVQMVKDWLEEHRDWLLVMDNADNLTLARSFLPSILLGHVIFTTRSQIVRDSGITAQLSVEAMEPEEGLLFLLRRSDKLKLGETLDTVPANVRETASQLVETLGGHPLALDQAGAYIEETEKSFDEYINLYQTHRRSLLSRRKARGSTYEDESRHPDSVVVTFELSFAKARELHPLSEDILRFCAFLQPDAIPEELFQHDDSFELDTLAFDEGIVALRRYSLLKYNLDDKIYSLHRLVQAVIVDMTLPEVQKQWRNRVIRALGATFPEVDYSKWVQCERLLPHALVCAAWTVDESTLTLSAARVFYEAGHYLHDRGRYAEAEALLERVLPIYEQHFGPDHPNMATILEALGIIHYLRDNDEQTEPMLQRTLAMREKYLGAEHPDTLNTLYQLAVLYTKQYKYDQAYALLVRVLTVLEKQPEDHRMVPILERLGSIYHAQDKNEQAELLYRRAIRIGEKCLGPTHPDIAPPLFGLSMILYEHGDHEQAHAAYQRALTIEERRVGETHPYIQNIKSLYAVFLRPIIGPES